MANHLFVMHLAEAAAVGPVAADTLAGHHTAAAFAAAGRMIAVPVLRIAARDAGTDFRMYHLAADFEAAYMAGYKPAASAA